MPLKVDPMIDAVPEFDPDSDQIRMLSGKLVSFRYLLGALRRRRRLWIATAVLGLLLGGVFRVVSPPKFTAYSTLYVAHAPGSDDQVGIGNDVALLDNTAVARGAIARLHEPSLSPTQLLGKDPGTPVSDNVLTITIKGPSAAEAVRRVNAVTASYLAFRAKQYNAQDDAIVVGLYKQIRLLEARENTLTNSIDDPSTGSAQLTQFVNERSEDQAEVTNLQQTTQQDQLDTVSVVTATRVLTPGTLIASSKIKGMVIDCLSGLGAGLAIGLGIVILHALASDRVRRREDVATLLGASVDVSVGSLRALYRDGGRGRFRRPWFRHSIPKSLVTNPGPQLTEVVQYLRSCLEPQPRSILAVAVDDVRLPAIAMVATAVASAREGNEVVLIDITADRALESMCSSKDDPIHRVQIDDNVGFTLFIPPRELGPEDDRAPWQLSADRWPQADVVLALATVDIARGAWHLRGWKQAIVTVTAGNSTPQRISGTAELLRASGVAVVASVLFGADDNDESLGLGEMGVSWRTAPQIGLQVPPTPASWQ